MESFNYLKSFCRLLEKTEVPPRFAIWSGIASLLAALERRVWINQGAYTIYPNFYMVLLAASGQKKSTAINKCAKVLRALNPAPNVISQKITPEALIGALRTTTNTEGKLLKESCGGIVIADELATFLDKNALERGLGPILTALFDCTSFEYMTKGRGLEKLEDGYLSILGGTTVELLKSSLPRDAIGGGFTSRTMFVFEESRPPPVAWIDFDEELVALELSLVTYLQRLMELNGAVNLTPEARDYYIADYDQRYRNGPFKDNPLLSSYENRRHAHLFKISMALMVCEEPQKTLEQRHIAGAKMILEEAEEYLPRVVELILASEVGTTGNSIFQFIAAEEFRPRLEIMRQFSNTMDSAEIAKALGTLLEAKRIEVDQKNGKLIYRAIKTHGARRKT